MKPELLLPVVREAVAALHPNTGHPALLAHPDDAALIRSKRANTWHTTTGGSSKTRLSPAAVAGSKQGSSEVDATLETRWKRVIDAIGVSQEWLNEMP